jgi:hypothetical protein
MQMHKEEHDDKKRLTICLCVRAKDEKVALLGKDV